MLKLKRRHLEILWEEAEGLILGPPFQPLQQDVWKKVVKSGIVYNIDTIKHAGPFESYDPEIIPADLEKRVFWESQDGGELSISGFEDDELFELLDAGKICVASIDGNKLAELTAVQWGLKSCYCELDFRTDIAGTCLIGWRDHETAVVITDFGNLRYSLHDFLCEIREIIQEEIGMIVDECFTDDASESSRSNGERFGPTDFKNLYVVNFGLSLPRTASQEALFVSDNVVCIGTSEFLTHDGLPIWDAKPRTIPEISYNESRRAFIINGKPLDLTGIESRIFSYIWENRNQITSIEELTKIAWPPEQTGKKRSSAVRDGEPEWTESNIYTHISNIRTKLKKLGNVEITNIRGKGYQISART